MKIVMLAALTALPFWTKAQQQANEFVPFPDNGIYLTSSDFTHRSLTDGFNTGQTGYRLHEETFRHSVKIDQPATKEQVIPTDNIWGERIKDVDYRAVNGEMYRVEHADKIYLYSKISTINQLPQPVYYFSREADSPVYVISNENLDNVYYDQPDKKALFDGIDNLSDNPVQQAVRLTQLFYNHSHSQPMSSAD